MKNLIGIFILMSILISGCSLVGQNNRASIVAPENVNEERQSGNKLDLSGQSLEKIPGEVFSKNDLLELDVSNNQIGGAIQAEIRNLKNLKVLRLNNNKMTGVPAEVGQLADLEILDLSNNQLTGLPYELGNLKNLKVLDISGNDYSEADLRIISENLSATVRIVK